jgi:hypothetical protein
MGRVRYFNTQDVTLRTYDDYVDYVIQFASQLNDACLLDVLLKTHVYYAAFLCRKMFAAYQREIPKRIYMASMKSVTIEILWSLDCFEQDDAVVLRACHNLACVYAFQRGYYEGVDDMLFTGVDLSPDPKQNDARACFAVLLKLWCSEVWNLEELSAGFTRQRRRWILEQIQIPLSVVKTQMEAVKRNKKKTAWFERIVTNMFTAIIQHCVKLYTMAHLADYGEYRWLKLAESGNDDYYNSISSDDLQDLDSWGNVNELSEYCGTV